MEWVLRPGDAPGPVRHAIGDFVRREAPEIAPSDAELVAAELLANALRHSRGAARISAEADQRCLRLVVEDEGIDAPDPTRWGSDPTAGEELDGRGLWIARCLADALHIDAEPWHTAVAAEFLRRRDGP